MWIIKVGEQFGYIYGFACTCLCCVNGWPQFLKTSSKTVLLPSTVKASRTKLHNLTFYFMSFCPFVLVVIIETKISPLRGRKMVERVVLILSGEHFHF